MLIREAAQVAAVASTTERLKCDSVADDDDSFVDILVFVASHQPSTCLPVLRSLHLSPRECRRQCSLAGKALAALGRDFCFSWKISSQGAKQKRKIRERGKASITRKSSKPTRLEKV